MSKKSTQEAKIINKQGNFVGPFFSSEFLHRLFLLDRLFFGSASAFFVIGCCHCCWKLLPRILIMHCKSACMYLKICPLQFWVPNVVAKGPYLVPISWKRTVATWVPMGTLFSCWVPIGSPFLFQGPHFIHLEPKSTWKVHAATI